MPGCRKTSLRPTVGPCRVSAKAGAMVRERARWLAGWLADGRWRGGRDLKRATEPTEPCTEMMRLSNSGNLGNARSFISVSVTR